MYCVHVMYPRSNEIKFDEQWWLDVHTPIGIEMLLEKCGVRPGEYVYTNETIGMDRTGASAEYAVMATMFMETKEEAEGFIDLFEMEKESAILSKDWDNYAGVSPVVVIGKHHTVAVDDFLAKAEAAKAKADANE